MFDLKCKELPFYFIQYRLSCPIITNLGQMSQVRVRLKTNSFNYSSNIEKLHRTKKKKTMIYTFRSFKQHCQRHNQKMREFSRKFMQTKDVNYGIGACGFYWLYVEITLFSTRPFCIILTNAKFIKIVRKYEHWSEWLIHENV